MVQIAGDLLKSSQQHPDNRPAQNKQLECSIAGNGAFAPNVGVVTTDDVIELQATGSDLFALPNAAMRSSSCAPRYQAVGVLPKPSSRRPAATSCPILSIVWPCFGQNCIKCVAVRPPSGNLTASFVTLERQRQ